MSERDNLADDDVPATPTEDRLARFLAEAMELLQRGQTVDVVALLSDRTDLVEQGRRLVENLMAFRQAAPAASDGRGWTTIVPQPAAPALGVTLPDPLPGDFRVLRLLGQGAFGEVWLAEDLHLHRQVALKTVLFRRPPEPAPERMEMLLHEARLLAGVHHSNVVPVYAWLPDRQGKCSECFLVMRYVSGGSLGERLRTEGPLEWRTAARYAADVAEGLLAVHAVKVLHRDIKPDNILWEGDEALLTDFGVSARLSASPGLAGTPLYMAPEALNGRPTEASDLYGLAATLFCLVSGEPPFVADTLEALKERASQGLLEGDQRFQGVPEGLERVIRVGLAPRAEDRPALAEFHEMLRAALNQAEVDGFARPAGPVAEGVNLRLVISRRVGPDNWQPVAMS